MLPFLEYFISLYLTFNSRLPLISPGGVQFEKKSKILKLGQNVGHVGQVELIIKKCLNFNRIFLLRERQR